MHKSSNNHYLATFLNSLCRIPSECTVLQSTGSSLLSACSHLLLASFHSPMPAQLSLELSSSHLSWPRPSYILFSVTLLHHRLISLPWEWIHIKSSISIDNKLFPLLILYQLIPRTLLLFIYVAKPYNYKLIVCTFKKSSNQPDVLLHNVFIHVWCFDDIKKTL